MDRRDYSTMLKSTGIFLSWSLLPWFYNTVTLFNDCNTIIIQFTNTNSGMFD